MTFPATDPPAATPRAFFREFVLASGVFALFLLFVFRPYFLNGLVLDHDMSAPRVIESLNEQQYQLQPALWVQSSLIKSGIFPSWTPFAQGGTPLIAKCQNSVFGPHHLLLYLLPSSWFPHALMAAVFLKYYLAFVFAYLYARVLKLRFWLAVNAGLLFLLQHLRWSIFAVNSSALFLPLQLLLIELRFLGYKRLVSFLWPWAVAFPFLGGHFEIACRNLIVSAAYLLFHLWHRKSKEGFRELSVFGGLTLLGVGLCSVQWAPAVEYVNNSYNTVWRHLEMFGWAYQTRSKHLSAEDGPLLLLSLLAVGIFLFSVKRITNDQEKPGGVRLRWAGISTLALAAAIASLAQLGLDDSLLPLIGIAYSNMIAVAIVSCLLVLSLWAWGRSESAGLRALGYILIGSILVCSKTPPIANIMANLPLIGLFNNVSYFYEWDLAAAVLGMTGIQHWTLLSRKDWPEKLQAARRALAVVAVLLLGYAASRPLKSLVTKLIASGSYASAPSSIPAALMGPERLSLTGARHTVAGWVADSVPLASAAIGLIEGDKAVRIFDATRTISHSGRRFYFHATLEKPEMDAEIKGYSVVARVLLANGQGDWVRGPLLTTYGKSFRKRALLLAAAALALPLLLCAGSFTPLLTAAALCAANLFQYQPSGVAASHVPLPLPAMEKIKSTSGLFRVSSLQYNFLEADYSNLYGLSDLRTGGDNLDVLSMIHFYHLSSQFMAGEAADREIGLKLLGLANVKYLLEPPGSQRQEAGLQPFYQGSDMRVYLNRSFQERARFFGEYSYFPLGNWRDWLGRARFMAPIMQMLSQKQLDPSNKLLVHDPPAAPSTPSQGSVRIDKYTPSEVRLSVDASGPGLVMLGDNHFPGWKATVNGAPVKILRSWLTFRAVEVPRGFSQVVFTYQPVVLRLAAALNALLALAWLWAYLRYRDGRPQLDPELQEIPIKKKNRKGENVPSDHGWANPHAAAIESLVAALTCGSMFFWASWSAFVYNGGIQSGLGGGWPVQTLALCALGWGLVQVLRLARRIFSTIRQPQT